jgi:hypothetical protein
MKITGWLTHQSSYNGVYTGRWKIEMEYTDHVELLGHKCGMKLTL